MTVPSYAPRILIVEDDARCARTLAQMLGEDGYVVEIAFDGAAAIARLGRDPRPDVLVVDYMIPYANGITVATFARSRWPEIPLLIATSYAEVVRRAGAALTPPAVMLPKPLVYADLLRELALATVGLSAARTDATGTGSSVR